MFISVVDRRGCVEVIQCFLERQRIVNVSAVPGLLCHTCCILKFTKYFRWVAGLRWIQAFLASSFPENPLGTITGDGV